MPAPLFNRWPLWGLLASAAMLGAAHAFETFGHLSPCTLCLRQREVYWVAMAVAAIGAALGFSAWRARSTRWFCVLLGLIFLYGAGLAAYHAGAEWGWWKGPAACSGGAVHVTAADLARVLDARASVPACDKAPWVFLGLSMAGWNALISLSLAIVSGWAAARTRSAP
ncbi:MAG TPA: disulfide bond formation protein B [Caulobacteraceae bacterium]